MIEFSKHILDNGLTVLLHQDTATPMASVNLLYGVGSRNESPTHTGLAHLFEHLMFGGSANVPSFDAELQVAGGENNAFTNNDYTNYYIALPNENIATALWVESDRMRGLALNESSLAVQRNVVCEEFAQRYTNQPYGDIWPILRGLSYAENHPYSWATIGKEESHIRQTTLKDARSFYDRFYNPASCVLSIASPRPVGEMLQLTTDWFGDIDGGKKPAELTYPAPIYGGRLTVERDVTASVIYICFPIDGRTARSTTVLDVASDILSGGDSSRLEQQLVKERGVFAAVNCYITGEQGPGLFVVTARLMPHTSLEQAEDILWEELNKMHCDPCSDYELQKVRNKFEANNYFTEINSLNKAMNLAHFEFLGSASLINTQVDLHRSVDKAEIISVFDSFIRPECAHTLYYKADRNGK